MKSIREIELRLAETCRANHISRRDYLIKNGGEECARKFFNDRQLAEYDDHIKRLKDAKALEKRKVT